MSIKILKSSICDVEIDKKTLEFKNTSKQYHKFYIFNDNTKKSTHNTSIDEFKGREIILPSDSSKVKIISKNIYNYSNFVERNNVKLVVSVNGSPRRR